MIVSGDFLLLVPSDKYKRFDLIANECSLQTLLHIKAIDDLQSVTRDFETTIMGPLKTTVSQIGVPKKLLKEC